MVVLLVHVSCFPPPRFQAWELFPTCLLLFTIAGGKRGTRTVHEPSYGKFNAIEHITQSPRYSKLSRPLS